MWLLDQFATFGTALAELVSAPENWLVLFASTFAGIVFGALPGLTATLGVALLTTLTYGMPLGTAIVALLAMYVGAVYGGSYASILINIPGTAASAATAMDGYQLALKGQGGRALGLTTTASFIGTLIGTLFLVAFAPLIAKLALQFTSFEFFWLAFFGIVISGTLSSRDLVYKGWIAGLLGLALSLVGRDRLQSFPRFTGDLPALDGGLEIVPVLIGAFGIPQIMHVLRSRLAPVKPQDVRRIVPDFGTVLKSGRNIARSSLIGVGIGSLPGVGEDVAAWVSYGAAKAAAKDPGAFGTGEPQGVIACETANNSCIGGALIPLLTLGIPGSPPAAMLLGALLLHNVNPGPMLPIEKPDFLLLVTAVMVLASFSMWVNGMLLARLVIKVLQIPVTVFLPIVAVLCVIGSYSLGLNLWNLYLMVPIGVAAYFLTEMKYPIAPLVIGFILGGVADENMRRALMVSQGDLTPFFTRPVCALLIVTIVWVALAQLAGVRRWQAAAWQNLRARFWRGRKNAPTDLP